MSHLHDTITDAHVHDDGSWSGGAITITPGSIVVTATSVTFSYSGPATHRRLTPLATGIPQAAVAIGTSPVTISGLTANEEYLLEIGPSSTTWADSEEFGTLNPGTGGAETPTTVFRDQPLAWNVLTSAQRDQALAWQIIGSVQRDQALQWSIAVAVVRDQLLEWTVFGSAQRDQLLRWDIQSTAPIRDQMLRWDVLNAAQRDQPLAWDLRGSAQRDQALAWEIQSSGTASRDQSLTWEVLGSAQRDQALVWSILAPAGPAGPFDPAAFWGHILSNGQSVGDNFIGIRIALEAMAGGVNVARMNGAPVIGDGTEGNPWRGVGVPP